MFEHAGRWLVQEWAASKSLLAWLLLAAALFVPLERFLFRRRQAVLREDFGEDLAFYFLGGLIPPLFGALVTSVCVALSYALLPRSYFEQLGASPLWMRLAAIVVLGELGYYWAHRLTHEIPWLWRFHAVHHSPRALDWLVNTRAHPLDLVFTRALSAAPLLLLGLKAPGNAGLNMIVFGAVAFNVLWGFFIHSNLRWRLGPLEQLITTPAFHHWHHANDSPEVANKNYAAVFPWMDRLFGSFHLPAQALPHSYGVPQALPKGVVALLLHPFRSRP